MNIIIINLISLPTPIRKTLLDEKNQKLFYESKSLKTSQSFHWKLICMKKFSVPPIYNLLKGMNTLLPRWWQASLKIFYASKLIPMIVSIDRLIFLRKTFCSWKVSEGNKSIDLSVHSVEGFLMFLFSSLTTISC